MLPLIAPAPPKNSGRTILSMNSLNLHEQQQNLQLPGSATFKKKLTYSNMTFGQPPVSVVRRNARERNRVKQVNNGFVTLRQHIPQTVIQALSTGGRGPSKKLSKVDTLRLAVEYISRLQDLITDLDGNKIPQGYENDKILDTKNFMQSNYESATSSVTSSTDTSSYYTASPEPNPHYMNGGNLIMNTAAYSEASISPAPSSYNSDASSVSPNINYSYVPNSTGINYSVNQFKFEPYDDYSSIPNAATTATATTCEDEELLDYISLWQEQQ